jgi:iduronate 2-sulfatase
MQLQTLRFALAALLLFTTVSRAAERLNVLFIATDDLGNVLGRTKPRGLQTPHLDRLIRRGVFFERAYCQIPLCNPSRASVMTGIRPDRIGVYDLDRHFRERAPNAVTLSQLFKNNGWFSARVGKIYHYNVPAGIGTDGLDDPPSWQQVINPKGRDVADEALIENPTPWKKISAAMSWLAAEGEDTDQTDGMIATEAIRLLEENRDRPFFIATGFFRPHTPYVAPKKYFDRYPLSGIDLPHVPFGDRDDIPRAAIPHNIPLPDYALPADALRKSLRAYYACVSFVDAQVGRLLDALDRLKLTDRTLVVFWSDHGYHLGEHHLWQKRTMFDESSRAPLIIALPQAGVKGRICRRPVEFIDLYPTIADLAGLTPPDHAQGRSLRPLLEKPDREWNHPAFSQVLRPGEGRPVMGRAVTTDRFRYVEWNGGEEGRELYDHQTDAREITNLAERPEHATTVKRLRQLFEAQVDPTVGNEPFNPNRL